MNEQAGHCIAARPTRRPLHAFLPAVRTANPTLEQARALAVAQQAQIAKMQAENKWVAAGDVQFP
jgi:hypothetical protein